MKNSGIEWIGEIPNSWKVVQLASLFVEHKQKNVGMQCNNLLSLSYGNIKRKDINTADGLLPESFENYNIVDNGDIILRLTDLQNDQRSLRTGLCLERGIVTSAYVTLRKRNSNLNSAFMHYYLHSFDVRKGFYGMGSGVRQGLSFDGIRKLEILVPPQKTQEAIVSYLSQKLTEVDKLIEVQQAQIEKLKEYKQSVITEAVTKGLDPTAPMKDSGVEWIGQIPDSWQLVNIGNVLKEHKIENRLLDTHALQFKYGTIVPKKETNVTQDVLDILSKYNVVKPNIIMVNGLNLAFDFVTQRVALVKENGVITSTYIALSPQNLVVPQYATYVLKSYDFQKVFHSLGRGLRCMLSYDILRREKMPLPSLDEQKSIVNCLEQKLAEVDKLIALKQSKIEKLQEYKKSLIYEYVTGKKEVI